MNESDGGGRGGEEGEERRDCLELEEDGRDEKGLEEINLAQRRKGTFKTPTNTGANPHIQSTYCWVMRAWSFPHSCMGLEVGGFKLGWDGMGWNGIGWIGWMDERADRCRVHALPLPACGPGGGGGGRIEERTTAPRCRATAHQLQYHPRLGWA